MVMSLRDTDLRMTAMAKEAAIEKTGPSSRQRGRPISTDPKVSDSIKKSGPKPQMGA
jgi:hypothetical protein